MLTGSACDCGLVNPGPEHRANFPLLCAENPPKTPPAEREAERLRKALRALLDGWTFLVEDDDATEFEAALARARRLLAGDAASEGKRD